MKELSYEDWVKNPTPRMMWCWNSNVEDKVRVKVIYVINHDTYPVITLTDNDVDLLRYKHCAEIEAQRRMTNKELSWWLSEKPHREWKGLLGNTVHSTCIYNEKCENDEVSEDILIREDDGEWREPLVEVEE